MGTLETASTAHMVQMHWETPAQKTGSFVIFLLSFGMIAGVIGMRHRHLTLFLSPKFKHASWLCNASLISAKIAA